MLRVVAIQAQGPFKHAIYSILWQLIIDSIYKRIFILKDLH